MIFEQESLLLHIVDVLELDQKEIHMVNRGRNFSAISFRFRADTVLQAGEKTYQLGDHYVAYVPAQLDYIRTAARDHMIIIHFDAANYTGEAIEVLPAEEPEALGRLFREIYICWNRKEPGFHLRCTAMLYEIFARCHDHCRTQACSCSKIQNGVDYLHEHYCRQDLTIGEIAAQAFVSQVYFRKLFKAEYGVSPQKYIMDLRIRHGAGLIATGYCTLQEVAALSGFSDYKYFSVCFKKQFGVSPSEYEYNYMPP